MQNGNTKISWTGVAERMEHRTSKQCRERYTNNLDPSVGRKGNWTPDEDVMIKDMQHRIGNKWTKIAAGELYFCSYDVVCITPHDNPELTNPYPLHSISSQQLYQDVVIMTSRIVGMQWQLNTNQVTIVMAVRGKIRTSPDGRSLN